MGISAVGDADRPAQSEVCELNTTIDINEEILRLEITVNDPVAVTVCYTVQQLIQVTLYVFIYTHTSNMKLDCAWRTQTSAKASHCYQSNLGFES